MSSWICISRIRTNNSLQSDNLRRESWHFSEERAIQLYLLMHLQTDCAYTCLPFLTLIGANLDHCQGFIISKNWILEQHHWSWKFQDYLFLLPPLYFSLLNSILVLCSKSEFPSMVRNYLSFCFRKSVRFRQSAMCKPFIHKQMS